MADYTTKAALPIRDDLLLQIASVTNEETGETALNETLIAAAIAAAGGEIDLELGKRFVLPLPSVPGFLSNIAGDIAVYRLYLESGDIPDKIENNYNTARGKIKDIVLENLPDAVAKTASTTNTPGPVAVMGERAPWESPFK
ncbi:MAG: DUF1320 domain-containing protein [bacterium]|nr:DUF1320 domain-containing protein [bacterium]